MTIFNKPALAPTAFAVLAALTTSQSHLANASEIETITVTETRSEQNLNQVSRSIERVSENLIEQTQVDHIQQVLNRVAGVNLHRNSGQEMLLAIRSPVLTGAGACGSFLTLENGIALRPNGFCNVNELFESHYELAQSIEIVKGPTSAFYGSNGVHGAINIINPAAIDRAPFIKASLGDEDYQQLSGLMNTENFAVSTSLTHSGGFRDESGFDQQKVSLSHVSEQPGMQVKSFVTATNLNQETAGYLVGLNSYLSESQSETNANPEAYRDAKSLRVNQEYNFSSGLSIRPYARYSEMEFLQHFVPGKPVETNKHRSLGLQSQYNFELSGTVNLTLGSDLEYANIELVEEQFGPTIGSNFLVATIPQGKHYDYEVDVTTLAAFAHLQQELNPYWRLNAGLRIENIEFDYNNRMNSGRVDENGVPCGFGGCRFNRPDSRSDSFTKASPKLGLVYNRNAQSAYFNLSHGYRAPQATELYRLQRAQQVSDLDPEQIVAFDTGYATELAGTELRFEGYYYEKSDVILRDSDFFYQSGGKTQHKGVEFTATKALTPNLAVSANASLSRHTYLNNPNLSDEDIVGNEMVSAPNKLANLTATYQMENWQLQVRSQYVSDYFLNAENTSAYSGHTLFHARADYQVSDQLSVAVNIDNLFDKRYAERANYTSFTRERYFPGQPRNLKVSIKYQF